MPRVNPLRSLQNERNVAERIRFERERHGWSYEGIAKRLAEAGAPMQPSAVYKIEKGDPPRRITVDELVGFSKVFDVDVSELLLPMATVLNHEARAVVERYDTGVKTMWEGIYGVVDATVALLKLEASTGGTTREIRNRARALLPTYWFQLPMGEEPKPPATEPAPPDPVGEAWRRLMEAIFKYAQWHMAQEG